MVRSHRVWEVVFAVVLALLIAGSMNVGMSRSEVVSRSPRTVRRSSDGGLPSWNPNVGCAADLVAVHDVLGSAYPAQSLTGSRYQTNSTAGGVPYKRQLLAPCTITNVTGQTISSFVEIHGVYLNPYTFDSHDCSHGFATINGGHRYPDGKQYCDNVGDILAVGTSSGKVHIEFDQDWLAKGWCGSQTSWCNNVSAAEYVSLGTISLDVQGFVFWDGNATSGHWEIHPITAMRLSSGFAVSADPSSLEMPRNYTTRANVKVIGASPDPVALSVSGCPSATVCTLSPASGSPIFASSLRVNTSASSPRGTFNLVIGATNASLSRSVTVPLTIGDRVLATFHRGGGGLFSETDDTNISSGAPNTNFGKDQTLQVDGTCDAVGIVCNALVKFPAFVGLGDGQVPSNSTIVNASLVLFIKDPGGAESLYQVTEPWTESGATWNSFATPGFPGNRGSEFQFTPKPVNKFLSLNITAIAQRWVNGDVNQGILLASTQGDGTQYNSSESNAGRPTLRVEFLLPFDFSLAVSPSSGVVEPGGSVSATASTTLVAGSTQSVQYSCTNLPSGAACVFTPPTCSPTCGTNLVLATSLSTPAGTYSVSVQATNGTITRNAGFTLTVGGLVLYYDMENLTGTGLMMDLSGHGNDGTITGTTNVSGKVGWATQFNGSSDKVASSASISGLNQWTIALWVYWQDGPNIYEHPIGLGSGHDATFWFSGTTVAFKSADSSGNTVVDRALSSSITTGIWYHLAATFDGTTVKAYLDGVEAFSTIGTGTTIRSNSLKIGTSGSEFNNFFDGIVDEVLIYTRALNASEIAELAPRPAPSNDPILSYDMENLTVDGRMKDLSGHGNDGIITGTTDVAGKVDRARQFDGATDKVAAFVPVVGLDQWTIALWVFWQDGPNIYEHPIGLGTGHDATFWFSGTTVAFKTADAAGNTVVDKALSSGIATGIWYHLAATFDGTTVKAYLDGVDQFSVAGPATTIRTNSIKLGTSGSEFNNFFDGIIDEVLVYNRPLSASEIQGLAPNPPTSSDPILSYDMENLTVYGRMKDLSGNGNHGIITGTTDVAGKVDRARQFDGATDKVAAFVPVVGLDQWTIALWVYWQDGPNIYEHPIGLGSGHDATFWFSGTTLAFKTADASGNTIVDQSLSSSITTGSWHHLAATFDGTTVRAYLDGAEKVSVVGTGTAIRSNSIKLGTSGSEFNNFFDGIIDEVLVYNRALSDAEIVDLTGGSTSSLQYLAAKVSSGASPPSAPSWRSPTHSVSLTVAASPSSQHGCLVVTTITASDCPASRKERSSLPMRVF